MSVKDVVTTNHEKYPHLVNSFFVGQQWLGQTLSRGHSSDETSVIEVERRAEQLTEVYLLHLCL
jgi:hypothetical protein